jgi:hypothetical protein
MRIVGTSFEFSFSSWFHHNSTFFFFAIVAHFLFLDFHLFKFYIFDFWGFSLLVLPRIFGVPKIRDRLLNFGDRYFYFMFALCGPTFRLEIIMTVLIDGHQRRLVSLLNVWLFHLA